MRDLRTVCADPVYKPSFDAGAFRMHTPEGEMIRIIATVGEGWDHVSVSLEHRCPTWEEMERVKRAFFTDKETAMQLHVPPAEHINNNEYCLHMWRPHGKPIPRPPGIMVGIAGATPAQIRAMKMGVF